MFSHSRIEQDLKTHNASSMPEVNKPFLNDPAEFYPWFESRMKANTFIVEQIPFRDMDNWCFQEGTGNLIHKSGKFFRIEGLKVQINDGVEKQWEQPIINQPEIGILGIITKMFKGTRCFLMQAKMEPGNINILQLSPTVQATKSNYMQVHQGSRPPFLDFFLDRTKAKVLVDQLQSEQGARFLRKRNRNMIIEIEQDIDLPADFCWLTSSQLKELLVIDNLMNMDARSVLSCDVFIPIRNKDQGLHSLTDVISWFTRLKTKFESHVESIPLKNVAHWKRTEEQIVHESKDLFSVIAVSVQAGNREVKSWTQPLLKQNNIGLAAFLCKKINGVCHFLVQAKVEAGYLDIIELAPTVSTSQIGDLKPQPNMPVFANLVLQASPEQIRLSVLMSEEGGRFYHVQNRYMVVELEADRPVDLPENYLWMTLEQLLAFVRYSNYVAIETRSLLSCLKCF